MDPIQKGKQTNKTSNMCTSDKGKQTNKQAEAACVEAQMQGAVQSCVTCGVRYAMCQSMWKSFGDALEMRRKSAELDTQGHTLTPTLQEQRLFLKPEKCKFEQKEVEYLGLVISKDRVTMDLTKVCAVTE